MKKNFRTARKIATKSKNKMQLAVAILLVLFLIVGVVTKAPLSEILFAIGGFSTLFLFDKMGDWIEKSKVGG